MTLDRDNPLSPYLQIANWLRDEILSGRLARGQRVPSETELMAAFGVARMTVRNAKAVLQHEGLIVARQGSGVFVRANWKPCPACDGKGWLPD
jgi:GntR family transcriptional regulator